MVAEHWRYEDPLIKMYRSILAGTPKDQCRYVIDEKTSHQWDRLKFQVDRLLADPRTRVLDIPF